VAGDEDDKKANAERRDLCVRACVCVCVSVCVHANVRRECVGKKNECTKRTRIDA
jgi:hypothetical protein